MSIVTVIPAYKSQYIEDVLSSLEKQTVQPDRIIFSDDSRDNSVIKKIERLLEKKSVEFQSKIILKEGPKKGGLANIASLLNLYVGSAHQYFHILLDDDVISEKFYEMHLLGLKKYGLGISINKRQFIDVNRNIMNINQYPGLLNINSSEFLLLDKLLLYKSVLPTATNWLGELTNCLVSTRHKELFTQTIFDDGLNYYGLDDIGTFLRISDKEPLIFINRYLSGFRQSPHQNTSNLASASLKAGVWAWVLIAIHGYQSSLITTAEFKQSLMSIRHRKELMFPDSDGPLDQALHTLILGKFDGGESFIFQWKQYLESFREGRLALGLSDF